MSKINNLSLKEIINEIGIILKVNDIIYFCKNVQVMEEFVKKYFEGFDTGEEVEKFLIDNEKYIDKEKYILTTVYNYKASILNMNRKIEELKESREADLNELTKLLRQFQDQTQKLSNALYLGKGMEKFLTNYYYDKTNKRYKIEVIDSREYIDEKKINITKSLKRFDDIDTSLKNSETDNLGMEYILQSILLTDIYRVFPDEEFGTDIRQMILENQIIEEKIKTRDELERLKTEEFRDEYIKLIEETKFKTILPSLKRTLREYVQYIDIDKLLLISAYRFKVRLEEGYINSKICSNTKTILQEILKNIKNQKLQFSEVLQKKVDSRYEDEQITYSVDDIKKCLSQFTESTYLSSKEIREYREKISSGEINLFNISPEYIDIIFSPSEIKKVSTLSPENLIYVYQTYNWNPPEVIELYKSNSIPLEYLVEVHETMGLSDGVSFEELNLYYQQLKEKPEDQETLNKYKKYLDLYKEIFVKGREQEEIEKRSNLILEQLAESLNEQEYDKTVKKYYEDGIITLDAIVEWSNRSLIIELFDEGLISLEDMNQLAIDKKFPVDDLSDIYTRLINDEGIEYNSRLKLIKSGYVREEDIFDLYKRNLIFEKDLRQLAEEEIINEEESKRIINSRTMEELEKNSSIRLIGLNTLTKKNNDIYSYGGYSTYAGGKTQLTGKFIIDPNEREKFIDSLNAYRADTDLDEKSPFYNYEFYVIPDESGTIGLNSVVIAERYYEEKDTERKFAINNATYFFKYKDLMVLSNLSKSEMTKERENIVFTSNHVIANEKRDGRWATSVISNIAKTMLSSDLKEYNKRNQRRIILKKLEEIYSTEELVNIIGMAADIDKGKYICEIERITLNSIGSDISDDDESR